MTVRSSSVRFPHFSLTFRFTCFQFPSTRFQSIFDLRRFAFVVPRERSADRNVPARAARRVGKGARQDRTPRHAKTVAPCPRGNRSPRERHAWATRVWSNRVERIAYALLPTLQGLSPRLRLHVEGDRRARAHGLERALERRNELLRAFDLLAAAAAGLHHLLVVGRRLELGERHHVGFGGVAVGKDV